ncbi:MAG: TetR/AcrR family transcriptional regulator [Saprospiraceae bacterium]|nr:TetR/AcrR family transcriptional regulator [Saprospiraceae bacterium]
MNVKENLVSTAFDLFLKYGIKSVSMDDISRKLGISKKTIYSVINTKDELIDDVLISHLQKDKCDIKSILDQSHDAIDEMVRITRHILTFISSMTPSIIYDLKKYHPQAWNKIEKEHFSFIQQTIYNNLIRGQKEGLYRMDFDPLIIAMLYVNKSHAIVDEDRFPLDSFDKIKLVKEMIFYHLHGIVSEKGKEIIVNVNI